MGSETGDHRRGTRAGVVAAILGVLALGGAWLGLRMWRDAERERAARREAQRTEERRRALAEKAMAHVYSEQARVLREALSSEPATAPSSGTRPGQDAQHQREAERTGQLDAAESTRPAPEAEAGPAVRGSLSKELIRRVIRRHIGAVRRCYEQGLREKPQLEGRVMLKLVIGPSGAVQSVSVESSTLGAPAVERCITDTATRWTFPPPSGGGIVVVLYPFVLKAA